MAQVFVLLCCLLWLSLLSCGGSKGADAPSAPLAPGPTPGPAPVPAPTAAHSYFESMRARSESIGAYSLRDQAMLDAYAHGPGTGSVNVTYDFANDTYPNKQDAAKVTIPGDRVSLPNQVRLPIPAVGGGSLLLVWDAWFGREFAFRNTEIVRYKNFQLASPDTQIWTEVRADFQAGVRHPPAVAMVDVRSYGNKAAGTLGPNVSENLPLSPQAAEFAIMPETWVRYWALFEPLGEWHEFSLWVADETRDPVRVIDRRQLKPQFARGASGWESFWLEYNTSSSGVPPGRGPLVGYARNVLMFRNVADVPNLLQRPTR